jgi:hypothetical protein
MVDYVTHGFNCVIDFGSLNIIIIVVLIALLPCHTSIVDMLKEISHRSEGGRKTYPKLRRGSSGFWRGNQVRKKNQILNLYHMHMSRCRESHSMNELYAWNMTMCDDGVVVWDVDDNLGVRMWYVIIHDCVDVVLYFTFYVVIIEMIFTLLFECFLYMGIMQILKSRDVVMSGS